MEKEINGFTDNWSGKKTRVNNDEEKKKCLESYQSKEAEWWKIYGQLDIERTLWAIQRT